MGLLSMINGIGLETQAKKTANYDRYNQEIEAVSGIIAEKKLVVENLLKQKDFASLKQKLEKYKQQKGI
jgi:hypothetical protein